MDLTTIFKDDNAFEEAFKEVENEIGKEEQFKGHLEIVLKRYTTH